MRLVHYALWFAASFMLLATWGAVGIIVLEAADPLFIHAAGSDRTPPWIAYAGLVFTTLVWPALLLVLTHGKQPLGRMVRGWILSFALLNLLFATFMALNIVNGGPRMIVYGRDFSAATDVLLAAVLYAAAVVVVEVLFRRQSMRGRRSPGGRVGLTSASLVSPCPCGIPDIRQVASDPAAE